MPTETKSRKGIGGPKTAEGKQRVRLNALKTGLHAESREGLQKIAEVVGVSFDEVHQQMRDYYRPRDVVEETLVRRIARCTWRLSVIEAMEDHLLTRLRMGGSPSKRLGDISVLERRTDIQLHCSIQALASKRKQDRENMKNKLAELPPPGKWPRPQPDFDQREAPAHHQFAPERTEPVTRPPRNL